MIDIRWKVIAITTLMLITTSCDVPDEKNTKPAKNGTEIEAVIASGIKDILDYEIQKSTDRYEKQNKLSELITKYEVNYIGDEWLKIKDPETNMYGLISVAELKFKESLKFYRRIDIDTIDIKIKDFWGNTIEKIKLNEQNKPIANMQNTTLFEYGNEENGEVKTLDELKVMEIEQGINPEYSYVRQGSNFIIINSVMYNRVWQPIINSDGALGNFIITDGQQVVFQNEKQMAIVKIDNQQELLSNVNSKAVQYIDVIGEEVIWLGDAEVITAKIGYDSIVEQISIYYF